MTKISYLNTLPLVKAKGSKRLLAYIIDTAILFILNILSAILLVFTSENEELGAPLRLMGFLITVIYYFLSFSSSSRATPGMRLMKIFVGRKNGERLSAKKNLLRIFCQMGIAFITLGIAALWIFTSKRQALYDKLSDTYIYDLSAANQKVAEPI